VARGAGCPTTAVITDMNEVLGTTAGNTVEVVEAIAYLRGDGPREPRQHEVTLALSAELLVTGGLFASVDGARAACERALAAGEVAERFARMIVALGGPGDLLERPAAHLPAAAVVRPVAPSRTGYVTGMDVRAVGLAVVALGGGRRRAADPIDHAVGLTEVAGIGAAVGPDRPLCLVHARTESDAEAAAAELRAAVTVAGEAPVPAPVIVERIGG
jgi:thymidine phosphorylase